MIILNIIKILQHILFLVLFYLWFSFFLCVGMVNITTAAKKFKNNIKENISIFSNLCKTSVESNIRRNLLLLNLVYYLSPLYRADLKREKNENGAMPLIKKRNKNLRRVPTTLATYTEAYFNLKFKRPIKKALNFLFQNETELLYHFNHILNFSASYDLDQKSFLNLIDPENEAKNKKKKKSKKKKAAKKEKKTKQNNASNEDKIIPLEDNYPNYEAPEFIKEIKENEKFSITHLGNRSLTGHLKILKKLKKSLTTLECPTHLNPINETQSPFLFSAAGVPIGSHIYDFLPLIPKKHVLAFAHSFNQFFREEIEPFYEVVNIFCAHNCLHEYHGKGFFFVLSNQTIFHCCCSCGNISRKNFRH
jgi:hypothetical protein